MNLLIHSMPLWLELIALVFCVGGIAMLLWVFPARDNDDPLSRDRNHLLWIFIRVAVLAAMTGSAADILVRTAEMSGDPILSAIPSLPTVVLKSHIGRVWLIRKSDAQVDVFTRAPFSGNGLTVFPESDGLSAAQMQLVREGRLHNYLRMLWGKKILEWSADPKEALAIMIELNNKYALDGRDPCSLTGILWCLGKYDRPWGPERPIFGTVRFMSSARAREKWALERYLERHAPEVAG